MINNFNMMNWILNAGIDLIVESSEVIDENDKLNKQAEWLKWKIHNKSSKKVQGHLFSDKNVQTTSKTVYWGRKYTCAWHLWAILFQKCKTLWKLESYLCQMSSWPNDNNRNIRIHDIIHQYLYFLCVAAGKWWKKQDKFCTIRM